MFALSPRWMKVLCIVGLALSIGIVPSKAQDVPKAVAESAPLCAACHGENGVPVEKIPVDKIAKISGQQAADLYVQVRKFKNETRDNPLIEPIIPVIWGQRAGYLYYQLRDFKSGARKNSLMGSVVKTLKHDDMLTLAEYYAKKPWPRLIQPPAPAAVVTEAERTNGSIGCTGCHQGNYQGAGTQPRLAGQQRKYLERQMLAFRDGSRGNNPGMSDLMMATSKEQLAIMAQYLAGL
jgi:cytochrome c553